MPSYTIVIETEQLFFPPDTLDFGAVVAMATTSRDVVFDRQDLLQTTGEKAMTGDNQRLPAEAVETETTVRAQAEVAEAMTGDNQRLPGEAVETETTVRAQAEAMTGTTLIPGKNSLSNGNRNGGEKASRRTMTTIGGLLGIDLLEGSGTVVSATTMTTGMPPAIVPGGISEVVAVVEVVEEAAEVEAAEVAGVGEKEASSKTTGVETTALREEAETTRRKETTNLHSRVPST